MFGEVWTKDILMTDLDWEMDEEDLESQSLLTPTKKLCFKEGRSILKASTYTGKKESKFSQGYLKARYIIKPKNKRGIFQKMAFKIYLQLSLPISIQQAIEYGATETKTLEVITEIWKVLL